MTTLKTTRVPATRLDPATLGQLFVEARTYTSWTDRPVDDGLLEEVYNLARMAPTSANTQPMRVLFVKGPEAKARLKPALAPKNVEKTMTAPVTAIVCHDVTFYENLPKLYPQGADALKIFAAMPSERVERMASDGTNLQCAYLILAARALGLDYGPLAGFDRALVDKEFFTDTTWKSNLIVNLGYGDPATLYPRNERLEFSEACRIV